MAGLNSPVSALNQSIGSSDRSIGSSDRSIGSSDRSIGSSDRSIGSSNRSIGSSGRSIGSPIQSIGSSNRSIGSSGRSIGSPIQSIRSSNRSIGSSDRSIGSPIQSIGNSNRSIGSSDRSFGSCYFLPPASLMDVADCIQKWRSRPLSRVLSWTVIPLGATSPLRSSSLPGPDAGRVMRSLFGLAPGGVYRAVRRWPRTRCALTAPFHPYHAHPKMPFGGLLSVALAVGSRRPGITWHLALWSPDFPRHPCG